MIKSRDSIVFRILNTRWAVQLGDLSYSLYLIHAIILDWVNGHLRAPKVVLGVVTLGLAIVIAKALQLAVEKPLYRLRRHICRGDQVPFSGRSFADRHQCIAKIQ